MKRVWTLKLDRPISVLALTHSLAEGLGYLLNLCKSQISLLREPDCNSERPQTALESRRLPLFWLHS